MKRSEFEAKRLIFHSTRKDVGFCGLRGERMYSIAVAEDVAAAEAAGVAWEPEEEPLPERLEVIHNVQWLVVVPLPKLDRYDQPATRFLSKKEAEETARRYNAFPDLKKLANDIESGNWADGKPLWRLREILRGDK